MAQFESLLWERRQRRVSRARTPVTRQPKVDAQAEFTASPPGRLGRPLLAEIETYLEFFALAREDPVTP